MGWPTFVDLLFKCSDVSSMFFDVACIGKDCLRLLSSLKLTEL